MQADMTMDLAHRYWTTEWQNGDPGIPWAKAVSWVIEHAATLAPGSCILDLCFGIGRHALAEFPMHERVFLTARAAGDQIVLGAPNAMRGESHLGSPGAGDMVARGLCDILASDYDYPAMLGAVVRLHADRVAPLPALGKLVAANPAAALGLTDRGRIAPGFRADLLLLDWPEGGTPAPLRTWVAGRGGYSALPT